MPPNAAAPLALRRYARLNFVSPVHYFRLTMPQCTMTG